MVGDVDAVAQHVKDAVDTFLKQGPGIFGFLHAETS
jgi:hypothetical protein